MYSNFQGHLLPLCHVSLFQYLVHARAITAASSNHLTSVEGFHLATLSLLVLLTT